MIFNKRTLRLLDKRNILNCLSCDTIRILYCLGSLFLNIRSQDYRTDWRISSFRFIIFFGFHFPWVFGLAQVRCNVFNKANRHSILGWWSRCICRCGLILIILLFHNLFLFSLRSPTFIFHFLFPFIGISFKFIFVLIIGIIIINIFAVFIRPKGF